MKRASAKTAAPAPVATPAIPGPPPFPCGLDPHWKARHAWGLVNLVGRGSYSGPGHAGLDCEAYLGLREDGVLVAYGVPSRALLEHERSPEAVAKLVQRWLDGYGWVTDRGVPLTLDDVNPSLRPFLTPPSP